VLGGVLAALPLAAARDGVSALQGRRAWKRPSAPPRPLNRSAIKNRKLSKKRSSGRIDGAGALAMAIAAAPAAWTAKVDIAALIG
jgi:hypothetical protein